ncbi:MAG: magnesium/cobalt transporter CorA [Thaumarchaeota archaeon]|nr:magnesium/cobalt transporter CorA [Candidatus Geocrenenecus arthurdayi]
MNRGETTIRDTEVRVIEYSEGFYREDVIKDINQFSALTDKSKVTWIKVCGLLDREKITKLAEKFNIHPLTLEDILNTDQRPKIEEFYNYTYIVLRIFQFDPLEKELLSEQMSIIVGENFLISVEEKTNTAIQKIIDWIKSSRGIIRRMGIDYLLYLIIDEVINGYFLVLEEIEDGLEELEDELTTNPTSSTLQAIHRFKRQLLQFNKNTWPLREVIGTLGRTGHRFIDNQTIPYFRDLYDHTVRVIENTETLQVMLSDMLDVYFSAVSNRLNEVMKILTMIATVFMPLTFIAGIYGMNFKYMPELEWVWGYPAVLLIMAGIGLWMILYFRRKKWI